MTNQKTSNRNSFGLPSDLYNRLCNVLKKCAQFRSHEDLQSVFITNLAPWYESLPQTSNLDSRVRQTIALLHQQHNDRGDNALVLLLRILSECVDSDNALHHELAALADAVEVYLETERPEATMSMLSPPVTESQTIQASVCPISANVSPSITFKEETMEPPQTSTANHKTITWLHLSDLHFRQADKPRNRVHLENAHIVLSKLLEDIKKVVREENLQLDFIVFTGDVAFSAHKEEYKQSSDTDLNCAADFFDRLLQVTGLDKTQLFIVPGNHDVNWRVLEGQSRFVRGCVEALKDRDSVTDFLLSESEREMAFRKFDNYAVFIRDYLAGALNFSERDYFYVKTLPLYRKVAILGLNSAWMSACVMDRDRPQDRLNLLLGEKQVRDALVQARDAEIRIALMHHPLDWLQDFDRRDVEPLLFKDCDFVLHGHQHSSNISFIHSPDSATMIIPAGACYHRREYNSGEGEYNGYNFVRLDFSTAQGTIFWRRYDDRGGGRWTADTGLFDRAPQGKYSFKLPSLSNVLSPQKEREAFTPSISTPPTHTPQRINTAGLRARLERLDMVQIESLCLDYFPEVYDKFGRGLRHDEMVNLLLDHIRRYSKEAEKLSELLGPDIPEQQPCIPEVISIPAGEFWMGSELNDPLAFSNEMPRRRLDIPAYAIGKYPVTNTEYLDFVRANPRYVPGRWTTDQIPAGKENHPVVNVSFQDALAYCQWLSQQTGEQYRLPTEEEWEKAARGAWPETQRYPWGDDWDQARVNTKSSGHGDTTPVNAPEGKNISPFNVIDMVGNVWEWTNTPYTKGRYVIRGGSWRYDNRYARISCRGRGAPESRDPDLGFRVVMEA